mmetsp:Transcript_26970/g.40950  ORF Transcript_26970/g.40950 Transcript_26970/m.40950 type:complete len:112 (+) Transcript_26970:430-765(+)
MHHSMKCLNRETLTHSLKMIFAVATIANTYSSTPWPKPFDSFGPLRNNATKKVWYLLFHVDHFKSFLEHKNCCIILPHCSSHYHSAQWHQITKERLKRSERPKRGMQRSLR